MADLQTPPGTNGFRRLGDALGPIAPLAAYFAGMLALLSLSRLGLVLWQAERVAAVDGLGRVFLAGLRMDVLVLSTVLLPVAVLTLGLDGEHVVGRVWRAVLRVYLAAWLWFFVFLEVTTPSFVAEYDARPNRLFIEYLVHPREVFSTLWAGYMPDLAVGAVGSAVTLALGWRVLGRLLRSPAPGGAARRSVLVAVVPALLFLGARSGGQHPGADPSTAAFSRDALVNTLGCSSGYSVLYAAYRMGDEANAAAVYGELPFETIVAEVRGAMSTVPADAFTSETLPTLHRGAPTAAPERPLNLVIVLEESLGARWVGALGGQPLTPHLDALADEGWWFEHMYATGTRSARGVEAVASGFPPTPARSTVKLDMSERGFFTLATLLEREGYRNHFIYGGESQFDNMRGFLAGNGFHRFVDENDFEDPIFQGSWGVCDEDIFARAHEVFMAQGEDPFFALIFTVSNHPPFEFPDGRVGPGGEQGHTEENAVRYADHALGGFLDQARDAPYWDDTVFLVVADHDSQVRGAELVPIDRFHIPAVIFGPGVEPRREQRVASQLDLGPTLLSLIGVGGEHPMIGHDLTRLPPEDPGRAIMQYADNQAYLAGDHAVVLQPYKPPQHFLYRGGEMLPTDGDPAAERRALAHALLPSWLYRERLYRMPDPSADEVARPGH